MAVQKTEVNPFERRPLGTRLAEVGKYVLRLPVQAYQGFRHWSQPMRLAVGLLGLCAGLWATYAGVQYYLRKSTQNAIIR
jgi:hypothetical protein